jgi:hypothetical protein
MNQSNARSKDFIQNCVVFSANISHMSSLLITLEFLIKFHIPIKQPVYLHMKCDPVFYKFIGMQRLKRTFLIRCHGHLKMSKLKQLLARERHYWTLAMKTNSRCIITQWLMDENNNEYSWEYEISKESVTKLKRSVKQCTPIRNIQSFQITWLGLYNSNWKMRWEDFWFSQPRRQSS